MLVIPEGRVGNIVVGLLCKLMDLEHLKSTLDFHFSFPLVIFSHVFISSCDIFYFFRECFSSFSTLCAGSSLVLKHAVFQPNIRVKIYWFKLSNSVNQDIKLLFSGLQICYQCKFCKHWTCLKNNSKSVHLTTVHITVDRKETIIISKRL